MNLEVCCLGCQRLRSRQTGHYYVENQQIGAKSHGGFDSFDAVDGLGADFDITTILEERADGPPHEFVVVCNQDTLRHFIVGGEL